MVIIITIIIMEEEVAGIITMVEEVVEGAIETPGKQEEAEQEISNHTRLTTII